MSIDLSKRLNLIQGDCLEGMMKLESNSVDLLVTDPPYGYSFMGKDWDKAVPSVDIWRECLRVLKPGCFAFVMSAPRSDVQCEMILKLKEAGFEVGFTPIYWAYTSGFPKAMNVSKMVDKRLGVEPEIIGKNPNSRLNADKDLYGINGKEEFNLTKPSSREAKELDGLFGGFQPKPAVEVVLVAMKPIQEKTFVEQALKNGHGGTWLGRCRIPYTSDDSIIEKNPHTLSKGSESYDSNCYGKYNVTLKPIDYTKQDGRFPANLLVSDNVLDNGVPTSQGHWSKTKTTGFGEFGNGKSEYFGVGDKSKAEGFSRYFSLDAWWEQQVKELPEEQRKTFPFLITPKASKSEKNKGLNEEPEPTGRPKGIAYNENSSLHMERKRGNLHPTVKPLKLMQYLVTLGCNKGEIVLDPFVGSGTTCIASKLMGRGCIGIEMNKEYFEIAKARVSFYEQQKELEE